MSVSKRIRAEEFDRSVCFTFFASWVDAIKDLSLSDPQAAVDAFTVLADYCLYDVEPQPETNPWGFTWALVRDEAKRSINNRRRGFGAEDTEMSDKIREYHAEHPEASQRAIADAVGCSQSKVSNVLRTQDSISPPVPSLYSDDDYDYANGSDNHNIHSVSNVVKNDCEVFGFPLPVSDGESEVLSL